METCDKYLGFSGISTLATAKHKPYFYSINPFSMNKRLLSTLALVSLFMVLLPACGKDDPPPPQKTKTELITQSSWKFEKISASGIDLTDNSTFVCLKDNTITFATNLTGTITEGTTVCSTSTAGPFNWEFRTSETILYISAALLPVGNNEFKIDALTDTNLTLSQTVTVPGFPIPQNVVVTFKH